MGSFWAAALAQVRSWPRDRLFIWLLLIAPLSGMAVCGWPAPPLARSRLRP